MDHSDTKINNKIAARVYYSRLGKQIYLVDNKTDSELAKVSLCGGVDFFTFLRILNSGGVKDD